MAKRECVQYAVGYDDLLNDDLNDAYNAWIDDVSEPSNLNFLRDFIADELGRSGGTVHFVDMARGSYNQVLQFRIDDGREPARLALRFPQRGFSAAALAAERLENEVHWMQYIEEQSTVPVPHIYSWGVGGDADDKIGPYILMDYVQGQKLHACLAAWEKSSDTADAAKKRDAAFEHLAEILLELRRHRFSKIGSITKDAAGVWDVTQRPLTYDMHAQLVSIPGFSTHAWPTGPLLHARDYVSLATELREQQLLCLRNINIPGVWNKEGSFDFQEGADIDMERALKTARGRFLARRAMALPAAAAHLNDDEPFVLFNPDLCARNILVDPDTARVTALIDFEYTNAVPAAFANDPPVWLSSINFGRCLTFGFFVEWYTMYESMLIIFLAILERVEGQQKTSEEPPLSALMRTSWKNKTFLFNYALHRADAADTVYHDQPALFPAVPEAVAGTCNWLQQVHDYEEYTKAQIGLYEAERVARHGK